MGARDALGGGCGGCGLGRLGGLSRGGFCGSGLGVCRRGGGFGGAARAAGSGFGRVVVYVPPGAFELEGGRGERTLERAAALGAGGLGLGVEALDLLEAMAALGAAVLV